MGVGRDAALRVPSGVVQLEEEEEEWIAVYLAKADLIIAPFKANFLDYSEPLCILRF